MRTKDLILMEQAYQTILEAKKELPCPCTVGKKCKEEKCPCTKCKKSKSKMMKEMSDEDMTDGMLHTPEDSGEQDPLDDSQMQDAMSILQQYAQGDITNLEAAKMFKDLYEKGAGHGPSQDDQYYTKLR